MTELPKRETEFALRGGRLEGRFAWVFRAVVSFMCSVILWTISSSFSVIKELKQSSIEMQRDLAILKATAHDEETGRRLALIEQRLLEMERRRP